MSAGLARRIADFALRLQWEDLSAKRRHKARWFLADFIGDANLVDGELAMVDGGATFSAGGAAMPVRADGVPLYNFGCVVDDITMGITLIARGRDHLVRFGHVLQHALRALALLEDRLDRGARADQHAERRGQQQRAHRARQAAAERTPQQQEHQSGRAGARIDAGGRASIQL